MIVYTYSLKVPSNSGAAIMMVKLLPVPLRPSGYVREVMPPLHDPRGCLATLAPGVTYAQPNPSGYPLGAKDLV